MEAGQVSPRVVYRAERFFPAHVCHPRLANHQNVLEHSLTFRAFSLSESEVPAQEFGQLVALYGGGSMYSIACGGKRVHDALPALRRALRGGKVRRVRRKIVVGS